MADEIMRVFIIDSNIAWRDAIDTLLDLQPDMEVIGKCANNPEAISRLRACKPDVLLIGIYGSADDVRDFVIGLRRDLPDMAIVIHGQVRESVMAGLLAAGASCYLPRGSSPRVILQTIRDARYQLDVRSDIIAT